jgi:hypothetical protein
MGEIVARYKVVTPLMLGGANHAPEFRLASYVNVVRWWWRFLALGRYGTPQSASFWEAVLFGWSAEPFGRKRVSFRLDGPPDTGYPLPWSEGGFQKQQGEQGVKWLSDWSGINYLTAQGFDDRKKLPDSTYRKPAPIRGFRVTARLLDFRGASDPAWQTLFKAPAGDNPEERRRRAFLAERREFAANDWLTATSTLIDAMALLGLLGGLGARSRRGFGSLAIQELQVPEAIASKTNAKGLAQAPATTADYRRELADRLGQSPFSGLPPYTALSDRTQIAIVGEAADARLLMNDIGFALQLYRSWGERDGASTHKHRYVADGNQQAIPAGGAKTGYRFGPDHDWYLRLKAHVDTCRDTIQATVDDPVLDLDQKRQAERRARRRMESDVNGNVFASGVPHRIAFGLPHNYFIRSSQPVIRSDGPPNQRRRYVNQGVTIEPATSGRRASPLLLHFHRLSETECVAVACVAPAQFLPVDAKVKSAGGQSSSHVGEAHLQDFSEVADFIEAVSGGGWKAGLSGVTTNCSRIDVFPSSA